ncbi:diaminobutyrate acetyltransferase [Paenibacillus sp.]|uniref:diaminobutyrate acetyltransferase n=1 Tax=Paenibacillus sp. TaxID=58172 RepID=UPI002D4759C4|nr:diaminobutyrate acetyltransferase [Paenibacillus sp.]HZG87613.1 diaminobutyrate acetyltransferase [Paenibacillus sp.]
MTRPAASARADAARWTLRRMRAEDGAAAWNIVRESGSLDPNSAYCYMLLGEYFGSACALAEENGKPIGFVTGFRPPERPDTWFVWQIGVAAEARGRGLGRELLEHVLSRPEHQDIRYVEATISPSNAASLALFRAFARDRRAEMRRLPGFRQEWFPNASHEEEPLYRIGPLLP